MKRTSSALLIAVAVVGAIAGYGMDQLLTVTGRATFTPSLMLAVLLVILGALVVALALPIRRATAGSTSTPDGAVNRPRVDPFRALRVAMLAKASSMVGAGVGGFALGLLIFVFTRPVPPSFVSWSSAAAVAGAAALLVGLALYAEYLCTLPGDDGDGDDRGIPEPDVTPSHH